MRITQAYKEATRSSLVQAGAQLFAEHGFGETTLDQIAGVARATFYNYFKSKEDVALAALEAVFDQLQADLAATLTSPEPWRSKVTQFFRHIVHLCSASPELLWVWCVESVRRGAQAPQMLIDLVAAGQACGAVRKDQSPDDIAIDLSGITFAQIAAWYRQGAPADLVERLCTAVNRYLDGVCLPPGENP